VSAVSDEREYAAGIRGGVTARLAGQPHRVMHYWTPRFGQGWEDGWNVADKLAPDATERALIADDHRAHQGDLRYEPVSPAARALALDVAEGTVR
jgi:hypothetical protein